MKIRVKLLVIIICLGIQYNYGQQNDKPKLIVGIVVDQMRAEYLYRFQDNYTEKGFKRLMSEGFNVKNAHYNYTPTATGPGHASIYTGTTPTNHGIVNNDWFSREFDKQIYCAEDRTVRLVDTPIDQTVMDSIGFRSPKNLRTTTITDELKLFTNGRSKVIGISLKDRGAIFPAGHLADAAYWFNNNNGDFVTSSYYMEHLPDWLVRFNNNKKADSLLNLVWEPFLTIENYTNSGVDNAIFEKVYKGKKSSTFPYNLKTLRKDNGNFALLTQVPQGNSLLTKLAIETIKSENLGQGKETDFLTISYSSSDYVGHHFGIRSKEVEDTYVRMDREIAILLETLDQQVGKGNYILFLTADHGASDSPLFLESIKLPGKFYAPAKIKKNLNIYLSQTFGAADYIAFFDKIQVYFNNTETPKELVIEKAVTFLKTVEGVKEIFVPKASKFNVNSTIQAIIKNSYFPKNSGDILYHMYSGWMEERAYGTTHGTVYTSDTHVPLLWYGFNIPKGETIKAHTITQIAPTLSMLLNIPLPNASSKNPIEELFETTKK